MKIDFDGIQAFVIIADLGGFNKAAERLHVTQTALTRRIQKLESYLGLRLLDRTTRYVKLTQVGRDFLPQARSLVSEMTLVIESLKDTSKHALGHFTLACVPTMATHILPSLMREYANLYPRNRIRLHDGTSFEVRSAILNNQAELGISIYWGERHPELIEIPLFDEPLMFFCRESHPLSQKTSVTWSDMSGVDLIVVSNFTATRVFMDYELAKRGISVNGAYEVQHHATAIGLVAVGVGCAILPASTFEEGDRPSVCRIPLVDPIVKRSVIIVCRKDSTPSPAAKAFFELVRGRYSRDSESM